MTNAEPARNSKIENSFVSIMKQARADFVRRSFLGVFCNGACGFPAQLTRDILKILDRTHLIR